LFIQQRILQDPKMSQRTEIDDRALRKVREDYSAALDKDPDLLTGPLFNRSSKSDMTALIIDLFGEVKHLRDPGNESDGTKVATMANGQSGSTPVNGTDDGGDPLHPKPVLDPEWKSHYEAIFADTQEAATKAKAKYDAAIRETQAARQVAQQAMEREKKADREKMAKLREDKKKAAYEEKTGGRYPCPFMRRGEDCDNGCDPDDNYDHPTVCLDPKHQDGNVGNCMLWHNKGRKKPKRQGSAAAADKTVSDKTSDKTTDKTALSKTAANANAKSKHRSVCPTMLKGDRCGDGSCNFRHPRVCDMHTSATRPRDCRLWHFRSLLSNPSGGTTGNSSGHPTLMPQQMSQQQTWQGPPAFAAPASSATPVPDMLAMSGSLANLATLVQHMQQQMAILAAR
jgi:hypothetical protein